MMEKWSRTMSSSFNINQALYSAGYAKQCYINYYYKGNTMGISATDMGTIIQEWGDAKVSSWKRYAESDENQYEITDDEYNNAVANGRNQAKKDSGYNNTGWQRTWQITRTSLDGAYAVAGNTLGKKYVGKAGSKYLGDFVGNGAANKAYNKALPEATEKYTKEAYITYDNTIDELNTQLDCGEITDVEYQQGLNEAEGTLNESLDNVACNAEDEATEVANKAKDENKTDWGIILSCAMDLATAVIYEISKPNETQKEAIDAYANNMGDQQEASARAQSEILTMNDELQEHTDNANTCAEQANDCIKEGKTTYDYHASVIEYYEKAKTSGYQFTQEDIEAYQESLEYMTQLNADIIDIHDQSSDEIAYTYGNMEGYQDGFDDAIETIGNVEGYTEEVSKVDNSTKTQCYIEGASDTISAASAAYDTYKAASAATSSAISIGGAIAYGAAAVAAGVAAVMDGFHAKEQFTWAKEIDEEIIDREATQEQNAISKDTYDENIDYYEGYMEDVEDVTVIMPDDIDVPEGEVPTLSPEDPESGGDNENDPGKKPPKT